MVKTCIYLLIFGFMVSKYIISGYGWSKFTNTAQQSVCMSVAL